MDSNPEIADYIIYYINILIMQEINVSVFMNHHHNKFQQDKIAIKLNMRTSLTHT